jgi:hypothetical protein
MGPVRETKSRAPVLALALAPGSADKPRVSVQAVQLPTPKEFPVQRQAASPLELTLPFGFKECRVNAATFKALAGRPKDNLFRQKGMMWRIVEDSELIDLHDKAVVFKLGPVQIYS